MTELFLSELRRFRNGAAIYVAASLVLITVFNQMLDIANEQRELHIVLLLLYALSGLGFGLYQFGSYRQPSRWIWLQHRPLHRAHILAGIALASMLLIALAMALPLFLALGLQERFTQRVVDARHYAGAAYLALSTLSAWLAGAYIMLHRSRWAFVILVLPILLTMHLATYTTMLALALACNAVLLFLVYTVFRPNRYTGDDALATVASAAPLQLSFYIALLWGGSMLFQVGQMMVGVHPLSTDRPLAGGQVEARRFDTRETLLAGLATSADPRAAGWRAGLDKASTAGLGPNVRQYAVRDLVSTRGQIHFSQDQHTWTFSHDRMMYSGRHRRLGTAAGWFGAGGAGDATPFDSQPVLMGDNRRNGYLVNAHDLYELQKGGLRMRHVLHVEGAEQLGAGIALLGQRTALLTNRRVVLLQDSGGQPAPLATVPLPVPFGDIDRVEAAQVADGTLVSFVGGYRRYEGATTAAPQLTYLVDLEGRVTEVGRRELGHDFPVLFEHKDWWVSPVLHALVTLPEILIEKGVVPDHGVSRFAPLLRPRPAAAWVAMIALALASSLLAAWWSHRALLRPRARLAWCLACLLLGVPALLSLMVLQPRAERESAAAAEGASAAAPV